MIEIYEMEGFKEVGKSKRKKQIVLTHTSRNLKDYVSSLKNRYNGNNTLLPHYIISRNGDVFSVIPPDTYSNFMEDKTKDKKVIIITLENLGWLRKNPLDKSYVNWIGEKFSGEVYEKKWRGHYFWQPYTNEQIEKLSKLTINLCDDFDIPKKSVGHNVRLENVDLFKGIVTQSNHEKHSTHLNPSFDFNIFINKISDEQPV